ncbi:M81 family metallopeptidase [Bradyrhizobium sp. 200]|uniref:M81 family metallopeptidase n=1 Tax=Bradyrhizobium sp. 200 TaxID=2782665 RepID=UPI001FFEE8AF|nr:M81 family metallopeptidase [Bradyrhizobium sp. 200]UPJ47895.1 M81 family metallopeptidase [Bradyrhizobium sp. 200]
MWRRDQVTGRLQTAHVTLKVPIISPTVAQWTGASPRMHLMQRAPVWRAREVDAYINVFFGFPFDDVRIVGMTIQVPTNSNRELSASIARDVTDAAWGYWRRC